MPGASWAVRFSTRTAFYLVWVSREMYWTGLRIRASRWATVPPRRWLTRSVPHLAPHSALRDRGARPESRAVSADLKVFWVASWVADWVASKGGATPGFALAPDPAPVLAPPCLRKSLPLCSPMSHLSPPMAEGVSRSARDDGGLRPSRRRILGQTSAPSRLGTGRTARWRGFGLDGALGAARICSTARWPGRSFRVPGRRRTGSEGKQAAAPQRGQGLNRFEVPKLPRTMV